MFAFKEQVAGAAQEHPISHVELSDLECAAKNDDR
jgi:hypothetical protein